MGIRRSMVVILVPKEHVRSGATEVRFERNVLVEEVVEEIEVVCGFPGIGGDGR